MRARDEFFIGELAERSGASRDTIRYYESTGVLPAPRRSEGGYRVYGSEDVERLAFIERAKLLGLTLDEIAAVRELVDEGREPCVHVRRALEERLEETRHRVRELRRLEARIETVLARARDGSTVDEDPCGCPIIEDAVMAAPELV